MEGQNCFRTRWTQEPIFSGGALASLALPAPLPPPVDAAAPTLSTSTALEECLVMACGDTVNVVRITTGEVLCRYTLPVEDVILHIDAVTVDAGERETVAETVATATATSFKVASPSAKSKRAKTVKLEGEEDEQVRVKVEAVADGDKDLAAPAGSFIAIGTRALQIYVLRVDARVEPAAAAPATASSSSAKDAEEEVEAGAGPAALHYVLTLQRNWTAAQHAISVVHFSPSGTYLVSGATDGSVKVWNVFHHHLTHNLVCAHSSLVQSVCLDPSEAYLAVGSFEGHVTVFDFAAKRVVAAGRPHVQAVEAMTFNDARTHVYSIARDRRLSLNRMTFRDGRKSTELKEDRAIALKEHVSSAAFEGAGELLHIGAMDGVVTTYRVSEAEAVQVVRRLPKPPAADAQDGAEEAFVRSVLVAGRPKGLGERGLRGEAAAPPAAPDATVLYVGDAGFNVQCLAPSAAAHGQYVATRTMVGFLDQLLDVKLFPASSPLHRAVVTNSKEVRLYASDGCVSSHALRGHGDVVLCCAVSSDGAWIATGAKDMEVRVWSTATCETVVRGVAGHTAEVTSIAFNSKQTDTYLLLFSVSSDENLRMWDVGASLAERAAGRSARVDRVAEIHHRSGVNAAHAGPIYAVAVAPNDQYVATGGKDKSVNVWNITGKKMFREGTLKGHRRGVSALAFSPADRVLASASNDGSVRLWSLVSLTCLKALQVDRASVLQLSFFNAGTQIVTGNAEGVLRVWAIASSESVWSAEAHTEKIWALAVEEGAAVGTTVFYTGSADGVLLATEDYTAEEVARVREERSDTILQEQALANALRKGEFSEAFMLALRLSHPRHLRQVLVRWCAKDARQCEITLRGELLPSLDAEHMTRLLQYTREWITNSRHCMVATLVLYVLLSSRHFEAVAQVPSMAALVEPLLAYTRKHSQRQHDLLRRTYYIDYVIRGIAPNALTSMPPFVHREESAAEAEAEADGEPLTKRVRAA
ncbi:WD domain, G-beta repeat/Utp13 specific WD40 associated domain containing protein [Novymonas esmeraldas]|uniref:WD domain, G-beta repeat/Utp13 specific WD40 associated domain containing protein n=1 Tax=Novymonas esmeraldas TaxID=1808958 RepID=A0AAW0F2I9_9TRYP